MIVIFILVWFSIIVSLFMIQKENKKQKDALLFRIEELENKVEKMKTPVSVNDKIKKMNKISMELMLILQEKENDIKMLLKEVDSIKKSSLKSQKLRVVEQKEDFYATNDDEYKDLSLSEKHILEVLHKKRRAI